jgi:hypothetical protein
MLRTSNSIARLKRATSVSSLFNGDRRIAKEECNCLCYLCGTYYDNEAEGEPRWTRLRSAPCDDNEMRTARDLITKDAALAVASVVGIYVLHYQNSIDCSQTEG